MSEQRLDLLIRAVVWGAAAVVLGVLSLQALADGADATGGRAGVPVRLTVPSLDLYARVRRIEVGNDGVLDPPADYHEVGWWQRSAEPGAHRGQTVLTGHTVHTGGGVMDRLGSVRRGAAVRVRTPHGVQAYRVTRRVVWTKAQLARHAVGIFGQRRAAGRLVLITCTGWTGADYTSNVVVFARPSGSPAGIGHGRSRSS